VSNKLEAALGPINSFTDSQGDTYEVINGLYGDDDILTLQVQGIDAEVIFFKADATKIIALIAEAAK
jgi:hypothetical protein